ncbi:MAG: hypothetical protein Tsb0020_37760 [Haliangiales bacterium]
MYKNSDAWVFLMSLGLAALALTACAQLVGIEDLSGPTTVQYQFLGFANWSQDVVTQDDAEQDALMDAACVATFGAGRAATVGEIARGQIIGLPESNLSGLFLLGKCPDCAGTSNRDAIDGHARICVPPDEPFPTAIPWTEAADCTTFTRSAACLDDSPESEFSLDASNHPQGEDSE